MRNINGQRERKRKRIQNGLMQKRRDDYGLMWDGNYILSDGALPRYVTKKEKARDGKN